mmetsp:Transcript_49891/g.80479  ORF Transcript_49891/g.80479 Transcript_49891/m.80479 type:complete len:148 (-) Transcript_49891:647-1090(-)
MTPPPSFTGSKVGVLLVNFGTISPFPEAMSWSRARIRSRLTIGGGASRDAAASVGRGAGADMVASGVANTGACAAADDVPLDVPVRRFRKAVAADADGRLGTDTKEKLGDLVLLHVVPSISKSFTSAFALIPACFTSALASTLEVSV